MTSIVPDTGDTQTDAASIPKMVCPNCGQIARAEAARLEPGTGVTISDCICPGAHLWTVRWVAA